MYSGQSLFSPLICRETLRGYAPTFIHTGNGKMPTGYFPSQDYPQHLRHIKFSDAEQNRHLVFLTNNFDVSALTITQFSRCRWQVELFYKWI